MNNFNINDYQIIKETKSCKHPEHDPPMFLYIPEGQSHVHICPSCNKATTIRATNITF